MKGCVNDVSECRKNCRRNGLKEMSLKTSVSERGEKYVNELMLAGKMCVVTDCGVENCAVTFVILLMKNVAKSSAVKS